MKNNLLYFLSKYLNNYLPLTVGASKNTISAYSDTFKLVFLFAKEKYKLKPNKIYLETIDKAFLSKFSSWIINSRKCSNNTKNLRMSNIKAFFTYIQSEIPSLSLHAQTILQIPKTKVPCKIVEYISTDGIRFILQQPDANTLIGKKHLVILSFLYATAARVQELIDVSISDFKFNNSDSIKLTGKGNKARLIPLEKDIIVLLERYIEHEKSHRGIYNKDDLLFLNSSGKKFTRQGISYIIKKYSNIARKQNANLIPKSVHPHTFRHSRAMALLQAGVELIYIRDFLGHYSVTTTEIYAKANNDLTRKALLKVSSSENKVDTPVWQKDKNLLEYLKSLAQ
jgi:site-specific recombinase XerD